MEINVRRAFKLLPLTVVSEQVTVAAWPPPDFSPDSGAAWGLAS